MNNEKRKGPEVLTEKEMQERLWQKIRAEGAENFVVFGKEQVQFHSVDNTWCADEKVWAIMEHQKLERIEKKLTSLQRSVDTHSSIFNIFIIGELITNLLNLLK